MLLRQRQSPLRKQHIVKHDSSETDRRRRRALPVLLLWRLHKGFRGGIGVSALDGGGDTGSGGRGRDEEGRLGSEELGGGEEMDKVGADCVSERGERE